MTEKIGRLHEQEVKDGIFDGLTYSVSVGHEIDAMFDRAQERAGNDVATQEKIDDLHRIYTGKMQIIMRGIARLTASVMLLSALGCQNQERVESQKSVTPIEKMAEIDDVIPPSTAEFSEKAEQEQKKEVQDVFETMRTLAKQHTVVTKNELPKYLKFGMNEHSFIEISTQKGGIDFLFKDQKGGADSVDTISPEKLSKLTTSDSSIKITLFHTHPLSNTFLQGLPDNVIKQIKLHPETSLPMPPSDEDFFAHIKDLSEFSGMRPDIVLDQGVYDYSGGVWRMHVGAESPLLRQGLVKEYQRVTELKNSSMTKTEKKMLKHIKKMGDMGAAGSAQLQKIRSSEQYKEWSRRMRSVESENYQLVRGYLASANRHRFDMWYAWEKDGFTQGEHTARAIQDFIVAMKEVYKVDVTYSPQR